MKHFKNKCIGCEKTSSELAEDDVSFNKEHLTPKWLVKRVGTDRTSVSWQGKQVNGMSVTIPLCEKCNSEFGEKIERPVIDIFNQLETGEGISDYQSELLIRWMWKFEGIHWHIRNKTGEYSQIYTLKERVLKSIDSVRPHLSLCVSRIKEINPHYGDMPMGIDSTTNHSALFVSGVFSKLAIMTNHSKFDDYVPDNFSIYRLNKKVNKKKKVKVFFPKIGFENDTEAVGVTYAASKRLERLHDDWKLRNYV